MKDWLALNMTPGVGPRVTSRLLEHFGSAEAIFDAPRRELALLRLTPETIESLANRELHERAESEIERVRKLGGEILVLDDGIYPTLLRETYDPPVVLYVKGTWSACLDQPCVAIIGSRRCSTYGQNAALMLSRELAQRGVTIISGMARGIDAAAHRGALEAGGRTVGVMGTGLDQIYPRDHKKLADDILKSNGALVTQFPTGDASGLGKLSLSQSRYQRIESGRGRSRSGREFRFADYGAAGDGTEPRSICRARQYHLAQFFRDELSNKGSRRKAGAAMAGCRGGITAGDRRAPPAAGAEEEEREGTRRAIIARARRPFGDRAHRLEVAFNRRPGAY